jgi:hypothetical protein
VNLRRIRRQYQELVDGLDIPYPWSVSELCARLAVRRGRPIRLNAVSMPFGAPAAQWYLGANEDLILYEQDTSPWHQDQVILHEVIHMISGHEAIAVKIDETVLRLLMPNLDPTMIRRVLSRRTYHPPAVEAEVDVIAGLIYERARGWLAGSEWPSLRPGAADVRGRLQRSLEHDTSQP